MSGEGKASGRETEVEVAGEMVFVEGFGEMLEARIGQEGREDN